MIIFTQDLKTALKNMWVAIRFGFTKLMQFLVTAIGVIAILTVGGYVVFHYFYQSIAVIGTVMLCTWFLIELETAKQIREYEEKSLKETRYE